MDSMNVIYTAIKSIDAKKDLRKVFEDLQTHSSSPTSASFTFQWKDLNENSESIKSSIEERFDKLEIVPQAGDGLASKEFPPQNPVSNLEQSNSEIVPVKKVKEESKNSLIRKLKLFCIQMDGMGLRSHLMLHHRKPKKLNLIRNEVAISLKSASDPAKLVLDAMQGIYCPNSPRLKGDKDVELAAIRRICILLLEQLKTISPQITPQVKEEALKLAVEWKGKINESVAGYSIEILAFLQIIATYDLVSAFNVDELLDFLAKMSQRKEAIDLCRALGFTEKVPDFIQKLTIKGRLLDAVKFVFAFDLADKFPPVPILKTYIEVSKKTTQEVLVKGNYCIPSQNEAMARGIAALKAVNKCIDEYNLESQYLHESLEERLEELEMQMEQLEKQKAKKERKRAAATPSTEQQMPKTRRRPSRRSLRMSGTTTTTSNPPILQNQLQQSSFLLDRAVSNNGTTDGLYDLADQSSLDPCASSSSGLYGVAGNLNPTRSHPYSSDSDPSDHYNRSLNYGGYGLPPPQYHPSYYP